MVEIETFRIPELDAFRDVLRLHGVSKAFISFAAHGLIGKTRQFEASHMRYAGPCDSDRLQSHQSSNTHTHIKIMSRSHAVRSFLFLFSLFAYSSRIIYGHHISLISLPTLTSILRTVHIDFVLFFTLEWSIKYKFFLFYCFSFEHKS